MNLIPYIMFNGNCAEALEFYKDALGAEIQNKSTFGEAPMPSEEANKNKIMHATLAFDGNKIMASDNMPESPSTVGNNMHLCVDFKEVAEMEAKFNNLSAGGTVVMELQDTFWGAKYGMLKDKYDINWMFNCELKK